MTKTLELIPPILPKCTPETVLQAITTLSVADFQLYAPTLEQVAEELGVTRQRVEQVTKGLKADGRLQSTKELLLPGQKSNHERAEEEVLYELSLLRKQLNGRPPTMEELLSYKSLPNSTVSRTVKRLRISGKIRSDRRFLSLTSDPDFTEEDHFWCYVEKKGEDECWPWLGDLSNERYGRCYWNGKSEYAHRAVFHITHGYLPDPKEKWVTITCGTPACCNPNHVRALTPKERMLLRDAGKEAAE